MFIQIILILLLCSGADCCSLNNDLFITTPSPMEALSGSCLWIPCTYKPKPPKDINTADPVTGIWFKNHYDYSKDSQYVFSVSGDPSKSYPMNITGNLKNKNCTTMFHNLSKNHEDKYYFRVENSGFKATDVCGPLQITVRDSPWSPTVKVSGKQTETEVVTITCSAVTPCPHAPPQLTWDLHQGTAHITETNTNYTKLTQNITLTDAHDGLMIKCKASYPVSGGFKMADSNVTLSVSYGPKNTSIEVSPSGSLSAGQSVTLSCSSRAKPPVHHFTWFRHSSQGPANVSQGHTYSFNICEEGDYYCVASNTHGDGSSPNITLQITAAPGVPYIEVSGKQTETEVVTITCSAVTPCPHAPPQLTWDLHQGTAHITETNTYGTIPTKLTQNITLTDAHDGLMIKCKASYPVSGGFKATENTTTLNVTYGPKNTSVEVSPSGSLSVGQSVTLSCSSRAKPPAHYFTWFRHSSQGPANVSQGHTYSFNFTEEGQYYCVASNTLGNGSSPHITLIIAGSFSGGLPWVVILGTVIGVLVIICLGLFVWCFKIKHQSPKDVQQETFVQGEDIHYGEINFSNFKDASNINPDDEPQEQTIYSQVNVSQSQTTEEETVHYGELDFSKVSPKEVLSTEQEETVYSQVQVSKPADTSGQVIDDFESLYAKVKKN